MLWSLDLKGQAEECEASSIHMYKCKELSPETSAFFMQNFIVIHK